MAIITNTNPGTIDPSRQGFPPPPQGTAPPSSAPLVASTGEMQLPAIRPTWSRPTTGRGLPTESHPANVSHVRASAAAVVPSTSPARDVNADNNRPGGLPKNVCIR